MFEKLLQWFHQIHGLEFVAFRYFNAAGAGQKFGEHHRVETHLIPNILQVPLGRASQCEIYGTDYPTPDGTCIRDYIHIVDLAQAHMLALQPGRQGFYNLGNGDGYSVRQVIKMCEKVTGRSIATVEKPRRPATRPSWSRRPPKPFASWDGSPNIPALSRLFRTPGAGIKPIPMVIQINRKCQGLGGKAALNSGVWRRREIRVLIKMLAQIDRLRILLYFVGIQYKGLLQRRHGLGDFSLVRLDDGKVVPRLGRVRGSFGPAF